MNFLARLFGTGRTAQVEPCRMFLSLAAKWQSVCEEVRALRLRGELVLVVAHFPATLREARDRLAAAGIAADIHDRPLVASELSDHASSATTDVLLVPSPALVTNDETPPATDSSAPAFSIIVPEMHPLRAAEESVEAFAEAVSGRPRLVAFFSLEDPLLKQSAGPDVQSLLRQLGLKETDGIQSRLIERQVRQAQTRLTSHLHTFEPADSAEEWVRRNLPPKT